MKDIFNIYESILDDDEEVRATAERLTITAKRVNDWFKDNIPALYDRYRFDPDGKKTDNIIINDDGTIDIEFKHRDIVVYNELPDFIVFGR